MLVWPRLRHSRPSAFWRYDGPPHLRDHEAYADLATAHEDEARLDEARWQWLAANDAWIPGERELVEDERQRRASERNRR